MKYLITIIITLTFVFTTHGQTSCIKIIKTKNSKMTGFTGAHSYLKDDSTCSKESFKGKFIKFYYDEESSEPMGMYVENSTSRRVLVPFPEEEEISCLAQYEKGLYEDFFIINQSYMWTVWRCGAGGRSDPFLSGVRK